MIQILSQFRHYCLCEQCNECWSAFSGFKFSNDNDITLQLKYNAYTLLNYFLEHSYISNYHSSPHEGSMSVFLQNGTHPEALTNSGHMCVCVCFSVSSSRMVCSIRLPDYEILFDGSIRYFTGGLHMLTCYTATQ